jgi:hypothetical protein
MEITITKKTYPKLWEALYEMEILPVMGYFTLPLSGSVTAESVQRAENALATLSEDDFSTLCDGEESDARAIAARSTELMVAHTVLTAMFLA